MTIDQEAYKQKLEAEKAALEAELSEIGRKNPDNPSDWEALPAEKDVSQADENTVADGITDFEGTSAIVNTLETRLKDVRSGLDKMKHGIYGLCQICQTEIEPDRLEANPAARTCKEHMNG